MIHTNLIRLEALQRLGVNNTISKLFMSKNDDDFLVAWELVEDHPNCEYIRAYCKGNTSIVTGVEEYDWSTEGSKYYDHKTSIYTFGDIIIKN